MKDMHVSNRNMVSIIHWKDPEELKLFDKDIDNLTIVKDIRNYIKGIV